MIVSAIDIAAPAVGALTRPSTRNDVLVVRTYKSFSTIFNPASVVSGGRQPQEVETFVRILTRRNEVFLRKALWPRWQSVSIDNETFGTDEIF